MPYDHKKIEKKWQQKWEESQMYKAENFSAKQKFYALIEFPYPSGAGLHVGHPRPYTGMDVIARKRRAQGYNVLYPIGWDAFGLPTENYAIKTGRSPQEVTKENIATFTRQIKSLGISFDWSREVNTTDSDYYKWTQWLFLHFFKHGLAYKKETPINWCLSCKIGLANEEVVNGVCERCGGEVEKRNKEQWMLAITKYADSLIKELETVDYIPQAKIQQEHWIGRKEGINITYNIEGTEAQITVFTTRPDTNFGATFIVVAPESAFVQEHRVLFSSSEDIEAYIKQAVLKSDMDRIAEGRKKTGVFTGLYAINQLTGRKMPIYISDFVLTGVGTGAVVGVPGHDRRDFAFAKEKDLGIVRVVVGPDKDETAIEQSEQVQEAAGFMINSGFLDGMEIMVAKEKIMDYLEEKGWGQRTVSYKLRDWVFSRQRYWGEPIPLVFCERCRDKNEPQSEGEKINPGWIPLSEESLPLKLPVIEKYEPTDTGESPLASLTDWVKTSCPRCGGSAKRETDTMPNWAGSSWYFLRYVDPHNSETFASKKLLDYWMPVDWYNGGMEHTVLHLLYSRFWNQFLFDIGLLPSKEPYLKRTSHGMILAKGGEKMSKSKGNVVNPDDIVDQYGADTLRLYILFMGAFDAAAQWDPEAIVGVRRFLEKVTHLGELLQEEGAEQMTRWIHKTIKKVGEDIEVMKFNTAVAQLMQLVNEMQSSSSISREQYEILLILLAPFAPHLAEELWEQLGHVSSITLCPWPSYDPILIQDERITIAIQINGKLRGTLEISVSLSEEEIKIKALEQEQIKRYTKDQSIKKIIYVKNKLVSIVF